MTSSRKKKAVKETLFTVGTGLMINWPVSIVFLYISIETLGLGVLGTSVVQTVGMTFVALTRVYAIRMYFTRNEQDRI
jgi:hypothetical protein|tara:strand:- start:249 stop:482 length:234 start_codon:yes stop_codon:yes gene_type:complete